MVKLLRTLVKYCFVSEDNHLFLFQFPPAQIWRFPTPQKRFVSPYYLFTRDQKAAANTVGDVTPARDDQMDNTGYPQMCQVRMVRCTRQSWNIVQLAKEMIRVGKRGIDQEKHLERSDL